MVKKIFFIIIAITLLFIGYKFFTDINYTEIKPTKVQNNLNETLVKVYFSGGLCPNGGCFRNIEIMQDGAINVEDNQGSYVKNISDEERLDELKTALRNLEIENLKMKEFEGTCPTAYDGQKAVYEFYVNDRTEKIDSCEYVVDTNKDIYKVIWEIINKDVDEEA